MMKTTYNNEKRSANGFIYVASKERLYYELGILSAQSLKDFYPEAHITMFTHEKFLDKRSEIFDAIVTDIPIHYRTKMWGMARTPYDKTIYIDCDSQICHSDVSKMFDFLDSCDLFCGSNLYYTVGNIKWAHIDLDQKYPPIYHGSMWGYNKTDLTIDLMQTWFDEYIKQVTTPWPHSSWSHIDWQKFDMFTIWKLTCKMYEEFSRFNNLNIKILPRRWNCTGQDLSADLQGPPVIMQIDKITYRNMPVVNNLIKKSLRDEAYKIEKYKIDDPVIRYN